MAIMRTVGSGHTLPAHATVHERDAEYVIELDMAGFAASELAVDILGRRLSVRGDQLETSADRGAVFRLHERLEESFLLPDDAVPAEISVLFKHGTLEIHAPRCRLEPRRLAISPPSYRSNPNAEPC